MGPAWRLEAWRLRVAAWCAGIILMMFALFGGISLLARVVMGGLAVAMVIAAHRSGSPKRWAELMAYQFDRRRLGRPMDPELEEARRRSIRCTLTALGCLVAACVAPFVLR